MWQPRNVKYSKDQIQQVRRLWDVDRETGDKRNHGRYSARAISEMTGVAPSAVWMIAKGYRW